jgi:hypothetical protein
MAVAHSSATGDLTVPTPVMTPSHPTKQPRPARTWRPTVWLAIAAAGATIALTGVTFWLSYEALHDLAAGHHLTGRRAWAWPGCIDAFLVVGEVLILRASLLRRIDWLAVALVALGSVGSIVLNVVSVGARVDHTTQVVAAVPPVAALLAFTALMRQIYRALTATPVVPTPPGEQLPADEDVEDEAPTAIEPAATPVMTQLPPVIPPQPALPPAIQQPIVVQAPAPAPIVYSDPRCAAIRPLYDGGYRPGTAAMRQALLDAGHGTVSDGMIRGTLRTEVEQREPRLGELPPAPVQFAARRVI